MQRDLFDRWLAERTLRDPRGNVPVGEAVRDYQDYCRKHGTEPGSGNAFGRAMTAIRRERGHPVRDCGRYWGIRLRERVGTGFDDDFSHLI